MFTVQFIAISGSICCLGGWLIGYLVSEFVMGCKHVDEYDEKYQLDVTIMIYYHK